MKQFLMFRCFFLVVFLTGTHTIYSQIEPNVYLSKEGKDGSTIHEIKIDANYFVHSVYKENPNEFISTMGGFYKINKGFIEVQLEFNSNYEKDSITQSKYQFEMNGEELILNSGEKISLYPSATKMQELDGQWLFGTRGPDKGQERRGDSKARKTLKFLQKGRFQWIAYNIETMRFSGTGGGSFTSDQGVYQENIEYFSRDNSRVGAKLNFDFEVKENDWHHTGNNSRGEPMYEIWMRRNPN